MASNDVLVSAAVVLGGKVLDIWGGWLNKHSGVPIECPHCECRAKYDLGTLHQGVFSRYIYCDNCNRKIKVKIEVEEG